LKATHETPTGAETKIYNDDDDDDDDDDERKCDALSCHARRIWIMFRLWRKQQNGEALVIVANE